jgi:hypothetical protein
MWGRKKSKFDTTTIPKRWGINMYVAMDSETKLIPCFRVGKRNFTNTWYFVQDLESRLAGRVQLTTDGFRPYRDAVEDAFGANVDYAMLVKVYSDSG